MCVLSSNFYLYEMGLPFTLHSLMLFLLPIFCLVVPIVYAIIFYLLVHLHNFIFFSSLLYSVNLPATKFLSLV